MTSLTSLPLSLQSRILAHLSDAELQRHEKLRQTNGYITSRHPEVNISLHGVQTLNVQLPNTLLAPALASPLLAAGAEKLVPGMLSYLTDVNTEGCLSLWVKAFPRYVKAISIIGIAEEWRRELSAEASSKVEEALCCDAIDLFRELSVNEVRLKVLDIVNVPFDKCEDLKDTMMTGLSATFESCQSSLKELALPVFPESQLCARVLESVTLPHLTVFSIELKDTRELVSISRSASDDICEQFLDMMQAVDGHTDRMNGVTTLEELRLINLYNIPCGKASESGCSDGFFRAIKTLRVDINHSHTKNCLFYFEAHFCSWFTELEVLYRTGTRCFWSKDYKRLCKRLREVHLGHRSSRSGVPDSCKRHKFLFVPDWFAVYGALTMSQRKIRTLVLHDVLPSGHLVQVSKSCPNLQYFSVQVIEDNLYELRTLLQELSGLRFLRVMIVDAFHIMGKRGWMIIGDAISCHGNIRELEIQTGPLYRKKSLPLDDTVDRLLRILKHIGSRMESLLFKVTARLGASTEIFDVLCRIMDCCSDHSWVLTRLDVDIIPRNRWRRPKGLTDAKARLKLSKEKLVESQPQLNRVKLGMWHCFLYD